MVEQVARRRGYLASIRVDNGTEFYSKAMDRWAYLHRVSLEFIRPGKPVENSHVESFNGRLRGECLNVYLCFGLKNARRKVEAWREDYNTVRPHGSFSKLPPFEYRLSCQEDGLKREEIPEEPGLFVARN